MSFFVTKILRIRRDNSIVKVINNSLYDLPSPKNISYWWGFGSLLGLFLVIQVLTGFFLAVHYVSDIEGAFESVDMIMRDIEMGWFIRAVHAKGASAYFLFLYLHLGRGMYYGSYAFRHTWKVGVTILILSMATAFLGYVLPWGQMSYWGATVITNFFSTVPYVGRDLVQWIWGGFAVSHATLTRFFAIHFLLPFVIIGFVIVHLVFLHEGGSNNPLGVSSRGDKIPFHPYFVIKDLLGYIIVLALFLVVVMRSPDLFTDPEKFIEANPLVTPVHIQPEWYFLPVYAILRSIPKKLGGVIVLVLAILVLYTLPFFKFKKRSVRGNAYRNINQFMFWFFVVNYLVLLWIGARPVEDPYIFIGQIGTIIYFAYFIYFFLEKRKN